MVSWVLGLMLAFAAPAATGNAAPAASAVSTAAAPLATPQFRRYGLADGLPGAMVYAVVQDHQGAMWFGTTGGIGRYDGVGFTVFRHDVADPHSLPNNQIYTLFVDRTGRLWAGGVSGGLSRYEPSSGSFTNWQHDDANPASLAQDEVWSIAQTPDGQLWVATQDGLDRLRRDGRGFEHVIDTTLPPDLSPRGMGPTRALLAEDNGRLWIGSERGIYLRSPDGALRRVPVDPSFKGDLSKIWRIEGSGDEVRVSTSSGVLRIGADGVAHPAWLAGVRSMSSVRDARGRLWVGTQEGAWLDSGDRSGRMFTGHSLLPGGLPADSIWQITRDREGGLWFAVADGGAAYLGPGWDGFSRMTHVPDDPTSLATTAAEVVVASRDNRLWVGEVGGIDKLDPATGAVEHMVTRMPESVISMVEDPQHRLWAAGQGALYVVEGGKVTPLDTAPVGLTRPTRLVYSDDGHVYVAAWGEGIFAIDTQSRQVQPVPMPDVAAARNVSVLATRDGDPWYASAAGLMRLDRTSHRMVFVEGVPQRFIMAVAFDRSGFWVAWENGLEHYRYAEGRAVSDRVVAVPAEWQSRDILGMRTDREDRLWLFATQGLWRFDPASGAFTRFGPQDGLLDGEFNNDRTAMLANGMIYGATKGGVVGFSPERLAAQSRKAVAPTVFLSALSVRRHGAVRALPVAEGGALSLSWRDRDLRVVARAASFINPAGNRFRFRLDGFDTDWVDVGPHGEREFAGLGAGDYRLRVMAAAPGGAWGALSAPLAIHVDAPPWNRWWAWLAYAGVAAALAATLSLAWRRRVAQRHRIQLAEQQRHLAEQANAAKTQFLATLSHEIRTPMTGVIGMAELLLTTPLRPDQSDYAHAMQRSGTMLLKLLNDALDLARIEAGRFALEPAPFDPRQLLDDVTRLVTGQARSKGIAFALELAPDLPTSLLGDALRIEQILLNLVTNAVKFTERGKVTLSAQRCTDGVMFSVADTGPGIPEASQSRLFQRFEQEAGPQRRAGSGLGLAICRELVTLMSGSIELESRLAHGSTFRVRLPLRELSAAIPAAPPAMSLRVLHVLLVEDDVTVAAVIRGLLERQGHAVTYVTNGLGALVELGAGPFDLLLLDLDLPGVDGFQLARMIRQREGAGERLPIVAITARSGGDEEQRSREVGMDHFLRKPLSGEQLARAMDVAITAAALPV